MKFHIANHARSLDLSTNWLSTIEGQASPQWWFTRKHEHHSVRPITFATSEEAHAFLAKYREDYPDREHAEKVVRVLSHEEAKRKATAEELRKLAESYWKRTKVVGTADLTGTIRLEATCALLRNEAWALLGRANELWPAKVKS